MIISLLDVLARYDRRIISSLQFRPHECGDPEAVISRHGILWTTLHLGNCISAPALVKRSPSDGGDSEHALVGTNEILGSANQSAQVDAVNPSIFPRFLVSLLGTGKGRFEEDHLAELCNGLVALSTFKKLIRCVTAITYQVSSVD